ncbi:MAG: aspartate aminotransferase family protein [Promethearchaeota archaeon]
MDYNKRLFDDKELLSLITDLDDSELEGINDKTLVPFYDQIFVSGSGPFLKDHTGKEYLDCTSQAWTCNIGFANPDVAFAVGEQLKKLTHVRYGFPTIPRIKFINRICEISPPHLKKVAANNMGGGAAIEAALRLAMINKPGAEHFYSFSRGYHGSSLATMSLSQRFAGVTRFRPWGFDRISKLPYPYCYRCPMGQEGHDSCHLECLEYIKYYIEFNSIDQVAGILIEPMQGPGGHIPAPKDFLEGLRKFCDEQEIYLIWDESQVFTRIGEWFAYDYYGVEPDITCLTKAIGGGIPMGVTLAREDMKGYNAAEEHSTFGANPLMFVGSVVFINYVEKANLLENTREQGKYLTSNLKKLQQKYDVIGDIRCPGLFIGIELVKDPETKEPANALCDDTIEEAKNQGIIFGHSAPIASDSGKLYRNILKIKPPLIITKEHCDKILEVFESALEEGIDYM